VSRGIPPDQEDIRRFAGVLFDRPGRVVELRVPKVGGRRRTDSGSFDDPEAFVKAATRLSGAAAGVYVTAHAAKPEILARSANQVREWAEITTSDHDIEAYRFLFVDIDPIRPAGIPSSDEEHEAALAVAATIAEMCRAKKWTVRVHADSGNGAMLLIPVDLPADDAGQEIIVGCLAALAKRFSTHAVKVDSSVANPARIVRIPGTLNAKGSGSSDRPHRLARIISVDLDGPAIPLSALAALAAKGREEADPPTGTRQRPSVTRSGGAFDVEAALSRWGLSVASKAPYGGRMGGTRYVLECCPWDESHSLGEAFVIQGASGAISAGCQHDSCTWGWAELRERFEPGHRDRHVDRPPTPPEADEQAEWEPGSFDGPPPEEYTATLASGNGRAHPILRRLCDVHAAPISWLWKPYLARGKLSLIQGDPEAGKTFVTLAVATAVVCGASICGDEPLRRGPVLLLTGEDGLEDTIVPRLKAMGADLSQIVALEGQMARNHDGEEKEYSVTLQDLNVLEEAVREVQPAMAVIDPIQAFLGGEVDAHRANEVRPILTRFARLATAYDFAAVAVQHLNKTGGGHAIYRGLGSIDFVAAARSVLLAGRVGDGSRAVVQIKNSLAPHGVSIGYTIAEDTGFSWTGPSRVTAADILAPEKPTAGAGAGAFLEVVLSEGPLPADEVIARAEEEGISRRTLYRARASIGVKSRQEGRTSIWYLEEVPERMPPVPPVPTPGTSRARGKGLAFGTGTDNPL